MTNTIIELSVSKGNVSYYYFLKNLDLYSLAQHATFAKAIELASDKGYDIAMKNVNHKYCDITCDADELLNNFSRLEQ